MVSSVSFSESEIKRTLEASPGDPVFVSYADNLRILGNLSEALRVCLAGLTASPDGVKGRLVLAQILYDGKYLPFALRELRELSRQLPQNESIKRLLAKLSPGESNVDPDQVSTDEGETMAEADFDFDDIELLGEDEGSDKS